VGEFELVGDLRELPQDEAETYDSRSEGTNLGQAPCHSGIPFVTRTLLPVLFLTLDKHFSYNSEQQGQNDEDNGGATSEGQVAADSEIEHEGDQGDS